MPGLYLKGHRESWKVLEQNVLAELGFGKTNLGVCWQDIERGWSRGSFSLYLSWTPDGEMEAWVGAERTVRLSLQELTQGWEGRAWLRNWPGMGVGLRETHPCPSGWEG